MQSAEYTHPYNEDSALVKVVKVVKVVKDFLSPDLTSGRACSTCIPGQAQRHRSHDWKPDLP